jgi:hypothetical protein
MKMKPTNVKMAIVPRTTQDPFVKHIERLMKLNKGLEKLADQANNLIEDYYKDEDDADIIKAEHVWRTLREIPSRMYSICLEVDDDLTDLEWNEVTDVEWKEVTD